MPFLTLGRIPCAIATLVLVVAAPPALAECIDEAPVPDVEIAAPGSDVPADYAKFVGLWSNGKWDGKLCNSLLVTSMDADGNADVVYAWGRYDDWRIDKAGFLQKKAKVKDDELRLEAFNSGRKAKYWFEDGVLKGRYEGRSSFYFVDLQKIE